MSGTKSQHLRVNPASPRAAMVLLFWSYFETRIERLLRAGLATAPRGLVEDSLERYSSIGSRLDRFYRVVFDSTYGKDLESLGLDNIWSHLQEVQRRRNLFVHGSPDAIDDDLVEKVVAELKSEHEAWIAVFNLQKRRLRATAP